MSMVTKSVTFKGVAAVESVLGFTGDDRRDHESGWRSKMRRRREGGVVFGWRGAAAVEVMAGRRWTLA